MECLQFYARYLYETWIQPSGPFFTKKDFPDLTNQTWVVTGGTGGIGLEIAKVLVGQNATVWIVGRNQEKLDAAIDMLREIKPLSKVNYLKIDYNDLETVKPGVQKLLQSTKTLDGVIHNAGVLNANGSKTKQGYEQTIGVNNLSAQLLQDFLDPLLLATPDSRIVWLSSVGHIFFAPSNHFDFDAVDNMGPWPVYGMSKALNIIQSVQWTKAHPESSTKSVSVHPGAIKTDIGRSLSQKIVDFAGYFSYPKEYGAFAPIYAALSPDVENNSYIVPWGRHGVVRPDVQRAAHGTQGAKAMAWILKQIRPYMNASE